MGKITTILKSFTEHVCGTSEKHWDEFKKLLTLSNIEFFLKKQFGTNIAFKMNNITSKNTKIR